MGGAVGAGRSYFLFDQRDHALLAMVNEVIAGKRSISHSREQFYPFFHPHGIKEMAESRGLRIAYATIHLLNLLEVGRLDDRLAALKSLRDEVIGATGGLLPRNSARVLLQLMKELVRAHDDPQTQLELAHDFRKAASGKPGFIRRQLRRFHLLEMPEEWNQLAFDDHVHDANTKGRKSASHLIMDAWIKGIRRLRVIYYNHITARNAAELMAAADIMGITLRIGIEFSARFRDRYVQLIWVPRGFSDPQSFLCFLAEPEVMTLMAEGLKVSRHQEWHVLKVLAAYNETHRDRINTAFGLNLQPASEKQFLSFVGAGQASLLHLSRFIHAEIQKQLPERITGLRTAYQNAADKEARQAIEALTEDLNGLDSETILDQYLRPARNPGIADPSIPTDDGETPELLTLSPKELVGRLVQLHTGYRITLNLSHLKAEDVLEILYDCNGSITRLEIFNLKDYAAGQTDHIPAISELQQAINQGNVIALKAMIRKLIARLNQSSAPDEDRIRKLTVILHDIATLKALYSGTHLKSRIGSDSTGSSSRARGMGLVIEETLPRRARQQLRRPEEGRLKIPFHVTAYPTLVYSSQKVHSLWGAAAGWLRSRLNLTRLGRKCQIEWRVKEYGSHMASSGNIVTLGGIHANAGGRITLDPRTPKSSRNGGIWPYLNSAIKNGLKVLIGFVPAFATFYLTKEWWLLAYGGAFIWFGITGLRIILQSVMGGGGIRPSPFLRWNSLVSWERMADSLLFTGFSVPLLDFAAKTLVLDYALGITTATHPILLYSLMALTNGIYLASHNIFRGFPKGVVTGNFFRSILSIPIAVGINAAAGQILAAAGVMAVDVVLQRWAAIISKAASDMVAGVIEGTADRLANIHLRRQDYASKFAQLFETYAQLELLFPEDKVLDLLEAPEEVRTIARSDAHDLERVMMICTLDMLYFWMYQPRARGALQAMLREMSGEERRIVVRSQLIVQRQREISLMLIEGILGKSFSRPLAFYLQQHPAYLKSILQMEQKIAQGRAGDPGS
jgi:hypothetical protein